MAIFYSAFIRGRTALCLMLAGFLIMTAPAKAEDSLYTIEGVKVDVTAENALVARDQAFEQAQADAFEILSERMVENAPGGNPAKTADMNTISSLIQDYEIVEEKLSSVRYMATYTFRFRPKAVERYFSGSGTSYVATTSRPVLILPFYEDSQGTVLWSADNEWRQAWNRASNLGGLVPAIVPLGDLQDVRDIGDEQALTYNQGALSSMLARYNATEAVVAIAEPVGGFGQEDAAGQGVDGVLRIHIYRTDRVRPEYVQQIEIRPAAGQSKQSVFDDAVVKTHAALQQDWKEKTAVRPSAQAEKIHVRVPIKSLQEWAGIQKSLERVSGVSGVTLKSLSPTAAFIDILFQGTENRLRLALQQADMTLEPIQGAEDGGYNNYGSVRQRPLVYELRQNRYDQGNYSNRF